MSEKKAPGKLADAKGTRKRTKSTSGKASSGFTDEERAALKERAQELKAATRRGQRADKADGESDVLGKIAEMPECRLLLPKRAEVQNEVRDVRLQRQGEPRRRRHVADGLRAEGVDRRRRDKDRRAREESGELRPNQSLMISQSPSVRG
jgi:hypothetical protein